jgi:hypothetical protein
MGSPLALSQDGNIPPVIEIVRWSVERDGIDLLVYQKSPPVGVRDDIAAFLHQELDIVTVTLEITDGDWTAGDPNDPNQQGGENEGVFLRFEAFGNILIAPPEPPPIPEADPNFFGTADDQGFTPALGSTVLTIEFEFAVPDFNGRNQLRLRGLIPMDLQYLVVFAASNEKDPENPLCGSFQVGCDAEFLNALENPSLAPPNPPPFADAGPDQTVESGSIVTLDGSRTIDQTNLGFDPGDPDVFDKDNLVFTWEWVDGPVRVDPQQSDANDPTATVELTQLGIYTYRLLVEDNASPGLPSTDDVVITVVGELPENRPPRVVISGPANAVVEGTVVTLDGSATSDPDNDPLTFTWQQTDELGGALPVDEFRVVFQPVAGTQSSKIVWQANEPGTYHFRLVVSDGEFINSARFSVEVIDRATAGFLVIGPADDGSPEVAPGGEGDVVNNSVGPFLPLCGAGLLPIAFAPLVLLLMRRRT